MHSLVRRFIKTAVLFLAVGLTLGGYLIVTREMLHRFPASYIVSAHVHALFVGFVMLMIMGVALWLFPRPDKTDARYSPRLASASYWIVTISTAARVAGEVLRTWSGASWLRAGVAIAGVGQIAGILLFFYTMWSRIRAVGSQGREAKGERF